MPVLVPVARRLDDRSPRNRRKMAHLAAYEKARDQQQGGAHLRREGLHSSLISEWHRLCEAGVLESKAAGEAVGRPSAEQAEIARLRRQLDNSQQRLATTETALNIMGKAHALLEQISESADTELTAAGTTTQVAAALTGVPPSFATRRRARTAPGPRDGVVLATRLTGPERARVLVRLSWVVRDLVGPPRYSA